MALFFAGPAQAAPVYLSRFTADTIPKKKVYKKVIDFFKFSKNLKESEKKRFDDLMKKVVYNDSLVMTTKDVLKLKDELQSGHQTDYASLMKIIEGMQAQFNAKLADTQSTAPPSEQQAVLTDQDLADLAARIIPLIKDKADADKQKSEKEARLKQIHALDKTARDTASQQPKFKKLETGDSIKYKIRLSQLAEVVGFHRDSFNARAVNYNYALLSTLVWCSYDLNGTNGGDRGKAAMADTGIINKAHLAGCKVLLNISNASPVAMKQFLASEAAQQTLTSNVFSWMERQSGQGIVVNFNNLPSVQRQNFVRFVVNMADTLHKRKMLLWVTLPALDRDGAYDVASLEPFVDKFIVLDFQLDKKMALNQPVAPLQGEYGKSGDANIQTAMARYLNRNVPSSKLILCVPYYGALWKTDIATQRDYFQCYLHYEDIRENDKYRDAPATYDELTGSMNIKLMEDDAVTGYIWYDDEKSLSAKYDYVLQNGFGGVAIWALGYDGSRTELWDALADKFTAIDTIYQDTVKKPLVKKAGIFEYLAGRVHFYLDVFRHPECYEPGCYHLDNYLFAFNIIIGILIVLSIIFFFYKMKNAGDRWTWRRPYAMVQTGMIAIFLITVFMNLFLSSSIPWFGVTGGSAPVSVSMKGLPAGLLNGASLSPASSCGCSGATVAVPSSELQPDTDADTAIPSSEKRSVPLSVILSIMGFGIIVGALVMRFLFPSLLQRGERP